MKSFLKIMFATMIGGILLLLLVVVVISSIASASSETTVSVEPNSILHLDFNSKINDRGNENPLENFNFQTMQTEKKIGLNDICKNISKAKDDDNIKGIFLNLTGLKTGIANIDEIREALVDFKTSGKFLVCHSDSYSQTAYYLASVSDKIYITPEGSIMLVGLGSEVMYFKTLLQKLGVDAKVVRHGSYKSAAESFMYEKMSNENREQISSFLGAIWTNMLEKISQSRNIPFEKLKNCTDSLLIKFPSDAIKYGLIDGFMYKDNILEELKKLSGIDADAKLKLVKLDSYSTAAVSDKKSKGIATDKIAVVFAGGEINMGDGDSETIGSENISKAIRQAREDENVKAIVLRVNSPGGSALASEIILREVILARAEKPVVASMGNYAASGGYYIACMADTILANPMTITGSIGVFGMFIDASEGLKKHLGINVERVTTTPFSDLGTVTRPVTPQEEIIVQEIVDSVYRTFINHVAVGRNMTTQQVDAIGGGRVWSGKNAKEIGLVDLFGGLDDAVVLAAKMAGIDNYRVLNLPEVKDPMQQIVESLIGTTSVSIIERELGENYKFYQLIKSLTNMQGIQARLPYSMEIR